MTILPVYAALLALLFVLLSIRTIRTRHSRKVALGHGDDPAMLRAMRVHANFAEYVPLALLLISFRRNRQPCPLAGSFAGECLAAWPSLPRIWHEPHAGELPLSSGGNGADLHGDPGERCPYPDHGAAPLTRPSRIAGEAVCQPSQSAILHCTDSRNSSA